MTQKKHSKILEEFPTLEDLMFKNKESIKRDKKKKSFKKLKEFNQSKLSDNDDFYKGQD